ncbi:unnamed protein product [Rangifer tarandus platyrhynchus]|uniref:Uncharacterized protein n=1 Tax=Rangifer tarandus platyrhynchus TaxID=3082113 RepID=A0ABN8ZML5_RANTA|nr:unnamed protein product [Rangifer tarandus platyrhynchus]
MHPAAAGVPVGIRALEARRRCGAVGGGGRFSRPPASPRALTPAPWCCDAPLRLGLLQQWDPPSWAAGRVLGLQARGSPRAPSARDVSRRCRTHTARRGVRRENLGLLCPSRF